MKMIGFAAAFRCGGHWKQNLGPKIRGERSDRKIRSSPKGSHSLVPSTASSRSCLLISEEISDSNQMRTARTAKHEKKNAVARTAYNPARGLPCSRSIDVLSTTNRSSGLDDRSREELGDARVIGSGQRESRFTPLSLYYRLNTRRRLQDTAATLKQVAKKSGRNLLENREMI